jgi:hypothetical protein
MTTDELSRKIRIHNKRERQKKAAVIYTVFYGIPAALLLITILIGGK